MKPSGTPPRLFSGEERAARWRRLRELGYVVLVVVEANFNPVVALRCAGYRWRLHPDKQVLWVIEPVVLRGAQVATRGNWQGFGGQCRTPEASRPPRCEQRFPVAPGFDLPPPADTARAPSVAARDKTCLVLKDCPKIDRPNSISTNSIATNANSERRYAALTGHSGGLATAVGAHSEPPLINAVALP